MAFPRTEVEAEMQLCNRVLGLGHLDGARLLGQNSVLFIRKEIISVSSLMEPLEGDPGMKSILEKCTESRMGLKNRNYILNLRGECQNQVFLDRQEDTFKSP